MSAAICHGSRREDIYIHGKTWEMVQEPRATLPKSLIFVKSIERCPVSQKSVVSRDSFGGGRNGTASKR
ncbi:hypothetical protein J6590_088737 [Homalodisca vitripennis]|nr:hypothetical protein J6590_088737 [Homalodisca vitripennis]